MVDETLAFKLELRAISPETAESAERLARAIHKLVENEEADGFHLYSLYINWPLINKLLAEKNHEYDEQPWPAMMDFDW